MQKVGKVCLRGGITAALYGRSKLQAGHQRRYSERLSALPFRKRNSRFKRPKSVGETRQVERNHPLECRRPGSTREEYHSAWRPKELLLLTYISTSIGYVFQNELTILWCENQGNFTVLCSPILLVLGIGLCYNAPATGQEQSPLGTVRRVTV
jgi:hypothetical protein